MKKPRSYYESGVDLETAEKVTKKISLIATETYTDDVISGVGPFAALFKIPAKEYHEPVLVSATDGVGTKILLHLKAKTYQAAGIDLVAMSANDILTAGAKPLFFLDYIACGKLDPQIVASFIEGMAKALKEIGASLVGGETAEMPGFYKEGEYDLSGFMVGIVEKSKIIRKSNVKKGDVVIGISSSGPHANGYSLIRKIIEEKSLVLEKEYSEIGTTLSKAILAPTRLYHSLVYPLLGKFHIHGLANITGGGFYENIPRIIPDGLCAQIDRSSFKVPAIFKFIQKHGDISEEEMYSIFNMGIGFVIIVPESDALNILKELNSHKEQAFIIGKVIEGKEKIEFK